MSEHLELISENISQWSAVSKITPEIQKKEIRPFVICMYTFFFIPPIDNFKQKY